MNKLRNAARVLLTLDEDDPKRIFEGNAILKRMRTYGLLEADKESLDYVLALNAEEFLERRLQTLVFKLGLAKSVHHARILIKQRHIRVGKQIVNVPSFLVRVETQKHIDFALNSPLGGGRPGRVKRRRMAQKAAAAGGGVGPAGGWELRLLPPPECSDVRKVSRAGGPAAHAARAGA